jgi:hypothetical protein
MPDQIPTLESRAHQSEVTPLSPLEEVLFKQWAGRSNIQDVDHPESKYDYRGYWKDLVARKDPAMVKDDSPHKPDTWKQHGHPTFSVESQYSKGPWDGGVWINDVHYPSDYLRTLTKATGVGPVPLNAPEHQMGMVPPPAASYDRDYVEDLGKHIVGSFKTGVLRNIANGVEKALPSTTPYIEHPFRQLQPYLDEVGSMVPQSIQHPVDTLLDTLLKRGPKAVF